MQIRQLAATFGRLENETLDLGPGLNIIEAPNEGGKSTWTAFLRVMLYGLNTRDRSPHADKRKYLPWSGSPMEGRMVLTAGGEDITILRRTARANAPMGDFSALYTGSSEPVPWLTAASCGEALLGVPQEVYERSAFIRQSGMTVDHSEALEQRIASLITAGEEDTSYTTAAERLHRQLTRRWANRSTGLIPQLERECTQLRDLLSQIDSQEAEAALCQDQQDRLERRQAELEEQLTRHDAADRAREAREALAAREAWEQARKKAAALAAEAQGLPERSQLEALRGTLSALAPVAQSVQEAEEREAAAALALAGAEEELAAHPLAGQAPEEAAAAPLDCGPKPRLSPLRAGLTLAISVAAAVGITVLAGGGRWAFEVGAAAFTLVLLLLVLPTRRRQAAWGRRREELDRQRQQELAAYTILYERAAQARDAWQDAKAARDSLSAGLSDNLARCMAQVRAFQPQAADIEDALTAVAGALARRLDAEEAQRQAQAAALRWELRQGAAGEAPSQAVERPVLSRSQLQAEHAANAARLEELRRRLHTAQGQLQALGDGPQLRAGLAEKEEARRSLQEEYDAISLAAQVLEAASGSLQKRFSPALGEKSAEIFTKLTEGKYNKVLLDRKLSPSAQEAGSLLPRESFQLSQGTADQLYLAVRLAICELVLPEENRAPLVLDDALVTFDDARMAAALACLASLAQERQILLFTCLGREAAFLRQSALPDVHVLRL